MRNHIALVIEDDKDVATVFAVALQAAGFRAEIIRSGSTALAWLAVVVPDLVILDLHLPGTSGLDILNQIRTDARLAETRVIVITGDPLAAEDIRAQADLVLIKPVSFEQLQDLAMRLTSTTSPDE
jgi:DNA-binding response OmpR family regulator